MFSKSGTIDKLIDRATSNSLLEPDLAANLEICDQIRGAAVKPKDVIKKLTKKLSNENPHVVIFSLLLIETCVKNCGTPFHEELACRDFVETIKSLAKEKEDPVKAKSLELIQIWAHALSKYVIFKNAYESLKSDGLSFPQMDRQSQADAFYDTETAPEWKESKKCNICRSEFGLFTGQHHCRNCGEAVCDKCSKNKLMLPKYGIVDREVRVCDECFEQLNRSNATAASSASLTNGSLPDEYLRSDLAKESQAPPPKKSDAELQEEEELQLALAISASEQESKNKQRPSAQPTSGVHPQTQPQNAIYATVNKDLTPAIKKHQPDFVTSAPDFEELDPELARYLNRNYWQQRSATQQQSAQQPSAPSDTLIENAKTGALSSTEMVNGEVGSDQIDREEFLRALRRSIEIFVNRMRSNQQRGRSIVNDSAVQTLFMTINAMHPKLLNYVNKEEEVRAHHESLQDKLAQIRDAREALDQLRADHKEQKRREAEEAERQRQLQMMAKLEFLRQKKHEYLEQQRQMAIQRMQEQEQMMQFRLAQQQAHVQQVQQQQRMIFPTAVTGANAPGMPPAATGYPGVVGMMPGGQPQMMMQQTPAAGYGMPQASVGQQAPYVTPGPGMMAVPTTVAGNPNQSYGVPPTAQPQPNQNIQVANAAPPGTSYAPGMSHVPGQQAGPGSIPPPNIPTGAHQQQQAQPGVVVPPTGQPPPQSMSVVGPGHGFVAPAPTSAYSMTEVAANVPSVPAGVGQMPQQQQQQQQQQQYQQHAGQQTVNPQTQSYNPQQQPQPPMGYMGQPGAPVTYSQPAQQQMTNSTQQPQYGHQHPTHAQPQAQSEAELISFD